MNKFVDYLTILQLGVGLNLVTGAYASHRRSFEQKVEEFLGSYRVKMRELLKNSTDQGPIRSDLQDVPMRDLSIRELNRLLGDVSIRFRRRSYQFDQKDRHIERALVPTGIFCATALIVASIWPEEFIAPWLALLVSVFVLGLPIFAFVRTSIELKQHEYYFRRATSNNYSDSIEKKHDDRMRSSPFKGEIHSTTNAIRTRKSDAA